MSLSVILLVLFAACLHATWNAIVKSGSDKMLDSSMIALGASFTALCALPFLPALSFSSWPYVLASVVIHFAYYQLVGLAYKTGDIGLAYPLMRGVAPMIVASTSGFILGETLSPLAILGVAVISAGVMTLAFESGLKHRSSLLFALMNAVVIATYTYVDGIGSRASSNPIAYTIWISILPPIPLFAYAIWQRGLAPVSNHIRVNWWRGLIGGAGSITSYGLALWAMSQAPIALVAALRETSILFALLISIFILKEKPGKWRILAGVIIGAGALVLKLG